VKTKFSLLFIKQTSYFVHLSK